MLVHSRSITRAHSRIMRRTVSGVALSIMLGAAAAQAQTQTTNSASIVIPAGGTAPYQVPAGTVETYNGPVTLGAGGTLVINSTPGPAGVLLFAPTLTNYNPAAPIVTNLTLNDGRLTQGSAQAGLITAGGGTLTLSNSAQYDLNGFALTAGGIAIQAGTILRSTAANPVDLTVGGGSFAGTIDTADRIRLVKVGTGTLVHSSTAAASNFAGIEIRDGTIQLSGAGNLGTSTVTFRGDRAAGERPTLEFAAPSGMSNDIVLAGTAGATLNMSTTNGPFTLSSSISGTGDVTKTGPGILIWDGAGTYAGNTFIDGGAILMGGGGSLPAGTALSLASGTLFRVDNNLSVEVGSIAGNGVLDLGRGGTLMVGRAGGNSRFEGSIRGTQGVNAVQATLVKVGQGTLTLEGNYNTGATDTTYGGRDNFSGQIEVLEGRLLANGNTGNPVSIGVRLGATLGGTGSVGSVFANGTVAPGTDISPIGSVLTVSDRIAFNSGSALRVRLDANTSDRVEAFSADVNAGASVQAHVTTYTASKDYTILTSGGPGALGGDGQFGSATLLCGPANNLAQCALLSPTLKEDGQKVYLAISETAPQPRPDEPKPDQPKPDQPKPDEPKPDQPKPDQPKPTEPEPDEPTPRPPSPVAWTPNQIAAAGGILSVASGSLRNAVMTLNVNEAPGALDLISGEVHAEVPRLALDNSDMVRRAILERLRSGGTPRVPAFVAATRAATAYAADMAVTVPPAEGTQREWNIGLWGQGFGQFGRVEGDGNAASFGYDTGGFVIGADTSFGDGWRAGIAGAFTSTSFEISDRLSSGSLDSWYISAYGAKSFGAFNIRGGAILAHNDADVNRASTFRTFSGSNASGYSGNTMNVFGEIGYSLEFGAIGLEPFVGLNHARFDSEGFAEEGTADSALQSAGTSFEQTYSHLGLRLSGNLPVGSGLLVANAGVAWRHAFGETTPDATLRFISGGLPFTVAGVPVDRDSVVIETGLNWLLSPSASLGVKYDGAFGERAREHALKGNFEVRF